MWTYLLFLVWHITICQNAPVQTEDGAAMTEYVVWKKLGSFYNRIEDLRKTTASNKEELQGNERTDWIARRILTGTGFLICLRTK